MACHVVDTFPAFLEFWERWRSRPLAEQVEAWANEYLAAWPELLAKQQADYEAQGVDWRQVARERVFPHLAERLAAMATARANLLAACPPTYARAQTALGFGGDVAFVIHVGIGCGAGWATTYGGLPAVLFGLENIAECGWSEREAIRGLVAHELGHLVHAQWRAQAGLSEGEGPFWQLYEEGFAQRCEDLIQGRESWHEGSGADGEWLAWCRANAAWLAQEYLRRAAAGEEVRDYFGSWYDIRGHSQCGYFLGHELAKAIEGEIGIRATAALDMGQIEARVWGFLSALAGRK